MNIEAVRVFLEDKVVEIIYKDLSKEEKTFRDLSLEGVRTLYSLKWNLERKLNISEREIVIIKSKDTWSQQKK